MKKGLLLWLLFVLSLLPAYNQTLVSGTIRDSKTGELLPFATVGIDGTSLGTLSNGSGFFELKIPESLKMKPVVINFLGYEAYEIDPDSFDEYLDIRMTEKVIRLSDIVVRPLKPEDYIRKAVRNINQTLGQKPYNAVSYYREKFKENGAYLGFTEGVFKSYYPTFGDSSGNQYQLMLYQTVDDPAELQFMKESMDKKADKKKKKAERKGEEYTDEGDGVVHTSFGGPNDIISMDLRNELEPFLDSVKFKKFRYSFGAPVIYQGRELLSVEFESRGTVEHVRSAGKIYIDLKSNAFVSIEYEGDIVIPFVVDPILFAVGISIHDPYIKKKLRYQLVDDSWYPEYFYIHIDIGLEKRHLFDPNEHSQFEIEQVLKVNEIPDTAQQIPEEKRFKTGEDPANQIHNDDGINWADINIIRDEGLTHEL